MFQAAAGSEDRDQRLWGDNGRTSRRRLHKRAMRPRSRRGVYQLGRYTDSGRMTMVGHFVERDAAIEAALPPADVQRLPGSEKPHRTGLVSPRPKNVDEGRK